MKKSISKIVMSLALLFAASGASALPPVFGPEYDNGMAQKDELDRAYISPVRIVWVSAGSDGTLVRDAENLLRPGNSQAEMSRRNTCQMKSTENEKASIMLDYGKELHGGLQLVLGSSRRQPSLVRIRFGESVGEANSETNNSAWKVGFSTDDHAKRDIIMEIPRDGLIEIGNTGFRFVRIDLLDNTNISIKEARAVLRYRDISYLGSFNSSDERLNRIWMTGAYTVHLNMQEYLWDGIKRDRVIWLGDMHPELMTITKVFGYNEVIPKSLDLVIDQFPLPQWMNGISTYSLWYLICHNDWYMQNGDIDFLKKHEDYIIGLIELVSSMVNEDGTEKLSEKGFLDWPASPNKKGVEAGCRALVVWSMKDAAKLCKVLGRPDVAAVCDDVIRRMNNDVKDPNDLKQAAALMAIAGIMPAKQAADEVVAVGGPKNFSTFYGYYMLQSLALAGEYETAMDIISQYWGGMLDMGATTFWEDFNLDWTVNAARLDEITPEGKKDIHGDFGAYCYPGFRHSLCHGWSSGPTAWMTEHVLGIKILDPGCKTVRIEPNLGNLEWVEGTFPTPHGVISVKHTKDKDGKVISKVDVPRGIKVIK